jgi:hypothetical protein
MSIWPRNEEASARRSGAELCARFSPVLAEFETVDMRQ